jgi:hypothetical protein
MAGDAIPCQRVPYRQAGPSPTHKSLDAIYKEYFEFISNIIVGTL